NIAIQSTLSRKKKFGSTILVSQLEHPSVINVIEHYRSEGFNVKFIKTTEHGRIDMEHLRTLMNGDVIFVTVMAVNNIVGAVQPIGKVKINYENVDTLSMSGHKFHGLKGSGALMIKELKAMPPVFFGGGHEYNIRSGTVNLPTIAAMAKALRLSHENIDSNFEKIENYNQSIRNALEDYRSIVMQP